MNAIYCLLVFNSSTHNFKLFLKNLLQEQKFKENYLREIIVSRRGGGAKNALVESLYFVQ